MGKTVKAFIFCLIFGILAFGGDLQEAIEGNLAKIPFSSKKELIKANNNLKNLYIKAIIAENEELQIKSLQGIIRSSKVLHFPYSRYEEAYKKLTEKSVDFIPPKKVSSISKIRDISFAKDKLTLRFDQSISDGDIKIFDLNQKNIFRKIIDIKTNLPFKSPKLRSSSFKRVIIAQNKKNLVRVVIDSLKPVVVSYMIDKDRVVFTISKTKKSTHTKSAVTAKRKTPQKKRLSFAFKKTIVIDPGHGGKDSGAIGYQNKKEKNAVFAISKKVAKELKKRGYNVYLTRESDRFIKLRERTKIANKKMADVFVSIHANAAPNEKSYLSMKGVETYFLSPARSKRAKNAAALENKSDMREMDYFSKEIFLNFYNREKIISSNKLAIDVQAGILRNLRKKYKKVVDGGVREGPFWVLVGAQMPSILIEIGYITNPTDAKRLFNPFFQKVLAKGICDGIESYFLKNR